MNLYESDKVVNELVISPETALFAGVFAAMTEWDLRNAQATFSQLTTLVLNLDPSAQENNWVGWHGGHISGLLAGATKLKVLALKVNVRPAGSLIGTVPESWQITMFEALLHGCRFPVLDALYLGNISATAFEIMDFLRRNWTLEALTIERCSLRIGLWRDVANYIKCLHPLSLLDAYLNQVWDGFEGRHWEDIWVS